MVSINFMENLMKEAYEHDGRFQKFPTIVELVCWQRLAGQLHGAVKSFHITGDDREFAHTLTAAVGAIMLEAFDNLIAKSETEQLIKLIHAIAHGDTKTLRQLITDQMGDSNEYEVKISILMTVLIESVGAWQEWKKKGGYTKWVMS